ncbi:ABC transporter, permease protein [Marvinbryantia formatexigens DSM 14469]|uniref:ABC transporter, permease protein n=1 Tax=Marvinbryantia formatexigens DSM 14469 TaxID=478749 RepID=C6LAX5_9FIRM|nr:sugar ABC transporter permease [Marvinbryantia formatexigens]EET62106.1 ABC transporter, permease protein [Marvinbryantia formatexigens DSM 14469]UWO26538.1 sugar ABC transporter permease [Marvinbryantia formatexigens DSM 14469]SDF76851.1 raffinose/stachyose/melibiose transport system permease protein [Marvinbryantia formatexigens]
MTAKRKQKLNWFYVPAVVIMLAFIAYPLGNSIYLSFFKWNGYSQSKEFIGISNYIAMFKDKVFLSSLRNTLIYGFGCTLLQQVIGLALAMFLNSKFKGRGIIRTVIYMPAMVSGLVMGYIMYFFFQYNGGVVNDILAFLGMEGYDWLGNGTSAIVVIVLINTWQFVGVSMVIYLAGIQGVSQSYIEAATVDGASAWQRFRYIILPLLVPALSSSVTYNLIGGLKLYDVIIALTDGGPAKKTHSLATYIANRYFDAERAGYAAAIGVFSFVLIMLIAMCVNAYFRKREVEY